MPLVPLKPFKTPRRAAAAQVAQSFIVPAPTGGLNYRDPIVAMAPNDAVVLTNMIPRQQGVELRKGWQEFSDAVEIDGVVQSVESVFGYRAPNPADDKIFMGAGGNIYDITAGGEPTIAVRFRLLTEDDDYLTAEDGDYLTTNDLTPSGEWWTTQFSTAADTFLLAVSPGGGYWTYSTSSGWVDRTATTTGLPSTVRTVAVWKQRVWFTAEEDSRVYYINTVNAITGACTAFPMGSTLRSGGYVSALVNWTMDAGISIDDFLVVIGTEGDIGVWEGTDPTSSATFGLKGSWYVGPVPKHGTYFTQFGGDVMIISELGLVPMSRLINGSFSRDTQNIGPAAKIQSVFAPLVRRLREEKFFNVFVVPGSEVLVMSLPVDGSYYRQFAMNLTTGAWCQFANMPIRSAAVLGGELYFGTVDGTVCHGLYGKLDGVAQNNTGGSFPIGELQCAFNSFGTPAQLKKFSMARNIFFGPAAPSTMTTINTQYLTVDNTGAPAFNNSNVALWDTGVWNLATWVADNNFESWHGVSGLGYYGSLRIKIAGIPGSVFLSSHMLFEIGGVM